MTVNLSLAETVDVIQHSPKRALENIEFLKGIIRSYGLYYDGKNLYGNENQYIRGNHIGGLWQEPTQFCRFLLFLLNFRINSFLDIGTFYGGSAAIITSYLQKFNPDFQRAITIDPFLHFREAEQVCAKLSLEYVPAVSDSFIGQRFDLCFIDGDHNYGAALADYNNVGQWSKVCAFHDINHKYIAEDVSHQGGPIKLWNELKKVGGPAMFKEFLNHTLDDNIMGIGVRYVLD